MVAEHLGGGGKIGYRASVPEITELLPMLAGEYFWLAEYREGVMQRWPAALGIAYRGSAVETVEDYDLIPPAVTKRYYNTGA